MELCGEIASRSDDEVDGPWSGGFCDGGSVGGGNETGQVEEEEAVGRLPPSDSSLRVLSTNRGIPTSGPLSPQEGVTKA